MRPAAAALTAAVVSHPKSFSQRPFVCSPMILRLFTASMMTSINGGRAFYVSPDHLEEDLLAHYVRTKNTTIPQ